MLNLSLGRHLAKFAMVAADLINLVTNDVIRPHDWLTNVLAHVNDLIVAPLLRRACVKVVEVTRDECTRRDIAVFIEIVIARFVRLVKVLKRPLFVVLDHVTAVMAPAAVNVKKLDNKKKERVGVDHIRFSMVAFFCASAHVMKQIAHVC